MAAVLDALASFVKDMLTKMASEEVAMLLGVSDEIDKLEEKLLELKDVLADAERRRIRDESVQGWVRKLKDTMYDATDILDICKLKAEERQDSLMGVEFRCFNPVLFCMRNPVFAHNIGSRIKELNKKLDRICKSSAQFSFIRMENNQDRGTFHHPDSSKTSPVIERSSLVGEKIQEDTVELVKMLTNEGGTNGAFDYTMVVAIAGTGGVGKTTLARNIYNHQTIKNKFRKRIWLSVTRDCTETELLRVAIDHAEGDHCQTHDKSLLEPTLANTIKDQKIFLVLDDMWSVTEWNNALKASFSHVARGSSILITTRHDGVARAMNAHYVHRINYLGPQDAWSLLKKQLKTKERDDVEMESLKNIGLEILSRCSGLPLAIKAIGGLLQQRCMNVVEWERVLNNPAWSLGGMPEELNHAIYLSYDDLPPHLKQCILYYSLCPKNVIISRGLLVAMWISEGLVSSSCSDDLESIGAGYYEELIKRNLIEPNEYFHQSKCVMHDVVRSFCQYMVKDEALVSDKGENDIGSRLGSQKFRLLSIEVESSSDELEWSVLQNHSSLRTLIIFGPIKFKPSDSLSRLSRLRTIHILGTDISLLAHHLSELKHLRYIACTEISRLPDSIGQLKFLQHIFLFGCEKMVGLPSDIVKLKQLRTLYLGGTNINNIPRGFGALTNLRALTGFPAYTDGDSKGWCTLEELVPLSQLRELELKGLENVHPSSLATKALLCTKKHLGHLILNCRSRVGDDGWPIKKDVPEEQRRIEEVFDDLCPPACINFLSVDGYFGHRLPIWFITAEVSLERLQILYLKDLAFCTQLPSGLGQLPCLEALQVGRAPAIRRVGPELMHYSHLRSAAFPRLNKLVFQGMVQWKEWEWKQQVEAMPFLMELILSNCELLTHLPTGLGFHARALKTLVLRDVHLLVSLENFPCVAELCVRCCHNLRRITNLPSLQNLSISHCPELQVLEGAPALRCLHLKNGIMPRLPQYLRGLNVPHLELCCRSLPLLCSMALGKSSHEWDKFCNIRRVEAHYCPSQKFNVSYTLDPRYLETNISGILIDILGRR